MLKSDLAKELRQRQYKLEEVSKEIIDKLQDDILIDCYITCSCCGEKQVNDSGQLERIIAESNGVEDFFNRCDNVASFGAMLHKTCDKIV